MSFTLCQNKFIIKELFSRDCRATLMLVYLNLLLNQSSLEKLVKTKRQEKKGEIMKQKGTVFFCLNKYSIHRLTSIQAKAISFKNNRSYYASENL